MKKSLPFTGLTKQLPDSVPQQIGLTMSSLQTPAAPAGKVNGTMRAVLKTRPERGVLFDSAYPVPQVSTGEVRIKVAAASVCGTDRELYEYSPMAQGFNLRIPVVLGHECSGTVVEVGPGVDTLTIGDAVALESHIACWDCYPCRTGDAHNCLNMKLLGLHTDGGFAEQLVVPAGACFKLPAGFPLEQAALLEPAGVAMHAIQRSGVEMSGKDVVISGGGPVGLLISALVKVMGARNVIVSEPNPYRRKLVEEFGAIGVEPSEDLVAIGAGLAADRDGFDVAFEASGVPAAMGPILDAVRREATVVAVGIPGRALELDVATYLIRKGLTLRGSFGRSLWGTWEQLSAFVAAGELDLSRLVTHRLALSELDRAITLLSENSCKVLLLPELPDTQGTSSKEAQ